MDESLRATLLGIIEGLTEFLPVSSTGHLIIFGEALGFQGTFAESFDVVIQLGAILAVVFLYWRRFFGMLAFPSSQSDLVRDGLQGSAGIIKLMIVTAPAAVVGLLFHRAIKAYLFNPTSVAVALIVGGIIMIVVERSRLTTAKGDVEKLTWKQALGVGIFQCFALWPGMSRSASSIVGGMLLGLRLEAAAEFSFLAAVPLIAAASLKEFVDVFHGLTSDQFLLLAVAFFVSFLSAIVAVRVFVGLIGKVGLIPFAVYRIILGIVVLLVLAQ